MNTIGHTLYRAFDPLVILLALLAGLVAAIAALIVFLIRGREFDEIWPQLLEILFATAGGAVVARAFVAILIGIAGDRPASIGIIWHFFLGVPGLVADVFALILGAKVAFTPGPILYAALIFGGAHGFYDALHRTRSWIGWGLPTFILDLTWAFALSVHGVLMMLINSLIGTRTGNPRTDDHVYSSGFRILPGFAFTQGCVISNWTSGDAALLAHERIHVMQNRIFGPIFLFFYVFWLVLFGFFGILVDIGGAIFGKQVKDRNGAMRRITFGDAAMWFGYYDNPWEVWAYQYGGWRDPGQVALLRWHPGVVIILTVLVLPLAGWLFWLFVHRAFG